MIIEKPIYKSGALIGWKLTGTSGREKVEQIVDWQAQQLCRIDLLAYTRRKINNLLFGSDCECRNHPIA